MKLNELAPPAGAKKSRKRIGRGQTSRSGGGVRPGFEGGQMPLQRRLPKRGFSNYPFRQNVAEVNLRDLTGFAAGSVVDAQALAEAGLIKGTFDAIKLLGDGEIQVALTVKVDKISAGAKTKVEAAGGSVELV